MERLGSITTVPSDELVDHVGEEVGVSDWVLVSTSVGASVCRSRMSLTPASLSCCEPNAETAIGTSGQMELVEEGVEAVRRAGEGAQHVQALDVSAALPDREHRRLAVEAREDALLHVAGAAEALHGLDGVDRCPLAREVLDDRREHPAQGHVVLVDQAGVGHHDVLQHQGLGMAGEVDVGQAARYADHHAGLRAVDTGSVSGIRCIGHPGQGPAAALCDPAQGIRPDFLQFT